MGDIHRPIGVPLRARNSFLFLERGTLHASQHSLVLERETGTVVIPVGISTVLCLEPGVSVTHAAIKLCADQGTLLLWVGEACVRVYSAGNPGGASGSRILRQAQLRLNERSRLAVARRLHAQMIGREPPPVRDIDQLRGIEGAHVRGWYGRIANSHGVDWTSRDKAPKALQDALGYATATLYGVAEAVILATGFSPAIGFIHTGDARSLVFDLADTVKFTTVVPAAFATYASGEHDIRTRVRRACRDLFRQQQIIDTLFDNLLNAIPDA